VTELAYRIRSMFLMYFILLCLVKQAYKYKNYYSHRTTKCENEDFFDISTLSRHFTFEGKQPSAGKEYELVRTLHSWEAADREEEISIYPSKPHGAVRVNKGINFT